MSKALRGLLLVFTGGVVAPLTILTTVLAVLLFMPLPVAIPPAKPGVQARTTQVLDAGGNVLGSFATFEQTRLVAPEDIPEVLKQAVISSEDQRFYSHRGVDLKGSARAFWADVWGKGYVQGGSTITQQYVKNTYLSRERTLSRKLREAILAGRLERQYEGRAGKDEILYRYLQIIYLGGGAYGVGAAAETYFRKPVRDLTLSESALLAGLIPAPSVYEPRTNGELAEQRRVVVLTKMLEQGRITRQQFDEASAQHVYLCCPYGPLDRPVTIVHPPQESPTAFPYFVDYVRRYVITRYGDDAFYRGGLRIQTTLDPRLQTLAEQTVAGALDGTEPPLELSLVSVEPATGFVKALVGGRQFGDSQVNLALGRCPPPALGPDGRLVRPADGVPFCLDGGGTGRQPGSAFKPFTLAKGFERGIEPETVFAAPEVYQIPGCGPANRPDCYIRNVEGEGGGQETLRLATWHSVNTVFAQLVRQAGIQETAELAYRLGLTMVDPFGNAAPDQPYGPQLTLGVADTSPLDMAGAYSVFANRGVQQPPTPVVRIEDASGKVLEDNTQRPGRRVLAEGIADNVTDVLRGVVTDGTGRSADIGRPVAGKTGSTDDNKDAWFVGYTPNLATSVWMGYADRPAPLIGIKGVARVYGGTIPARTWRAFMGPALEGVAPADFNQPPPIPPVAVELARERRQGFDRGPARPPVGTPPGGPYIVDPLPPTTPTAPATPTAPTAPTPVPP